MKTMNDFRRTVAEVIKDGGYGMLLGDNNGNFSKYILNNWDGILYMLVEGVISSELWNNVGSNDDHLERGLLLRMKPEQASMLYEDDSLDFIYINTGFEYEQTTEILSMWYPKLKAGGYMFGNNYLGSNRDWWYKSGDTKNKIIKIKGKEIGKFGVNPSVDEFVVDNQLDLFFSNSSKDWFGEWGFKKSEKTRPKKKSGFVQWRKELQNPDFEVNKPV